MKKSALRKVTAFIMTVIIAVGVLSPMAFACKNEESVTMNFKEDGTFRIMQMTDTHTTDQMYPEVTAFMEKVLDDYKPDLVVFTGDNVTGGWCLSTPLSVKTAIDKLVAPLDERDIPFTVVYGNHDWQTLCPKKLQTKFYQMHDNCVMLEGYNYIHRTANHNILLKNADNSETLFNLWLLDSGSRNIKDEQNPVMEAQNDWYREACDKITAANGGKVVPSIVFQHVPVEEVSKLFLKADKDTEGAVHCSHYGDDAYFVLNTEKATGDFIGSVGIAYRNSGQYNAWVEKGDVVGAFFGHDHMNDYYGMTDEGIILGSTKATGFQSRGDNGKRGVRIIDLDVESPETFETYSVYYSDYFSDVPESKREYDSWERITMTFEYIKNFFIDLFN